MLGERSTNTLLNMGIVIEVIIKPIMCYVPSVGFMDILKNNKEFNVN